MTAWELYLDGFDDPERRQAAIDWVESRPPAVRDLCHRIPPGSVVVVEGKPAYVVSYAEGKEPGIFLSRTDPRLDHETAFASRFFVCGSHFDRAIVLGSGLG